MPPLSFDNAFSIRIFLVSAFLLEVTQQIHSLRASGVISSHTINAAGTPIIAFRKSDGILCTTPPRIFRPASLCETLRAGFLDMGLLYQFLCQNYQLPRPCLTVI